MKNHRIFYLLHVSWFWIKQRPQFLAEEMSNHFPVKVACLEDYNCQNKLNQFIVKERFSLVGFWIWKFKFPGNFFKSHFNFWVKRLQLKYLLKKKYSFIWFSSPQQFLLIEPLLNKNQFIIYDCMDDILEFYKDPVLKKTLKEIEGRLCKRADLIITSAAVIKERLNSRYDLNCKIEVVNNGNNFPALKMETNLTSEILKVFQDKSKKYLAYIGTISEWFNFDEVISVLNNNPSILLIIVGPGDIDLPSHHQIKYLGRVPHSLVASLMEASDCLIMPFKITELVKAVNPVKAYEYIASGKPVILSKYEETVPFFDFAYLYGNINELNTYLGLLSSDKLSPKKNRDECLEFAKSNTWATRACQVAQLINERCGN